MTRKVFVNEKYEKGDPYKKWNEIVQQICSEHNAKGIFQTLIKDMRLTIWCIVSL